VYTTDRAREMVVDGCCLLCERLERERARAGREPREVAGRDAAVFLPSLRKTDRYENTAPFALCMKNLPPTAREGKRPVCP
jgi:hypothetical protein